MLNLQSSPPPSSWQKGTFTISDEITKNVKLKVNFFITTWISSKFNHSRKGHVLPTLIQFQVHRKSFVKVIFIRNSGERLEPDTHFNAASWKGPPACPGSFHPSRFLSWTPAQHTVTAGSYSKCTWQATKDSITGSQKCLVVVGWLGLYFLE